MKRPSAVSAVTAALAAPFVSVGRMIDTMGNLRLKKMVGSGMIRLVCRGGLGPARLRRVMELVDARIEDDLSLDKLAEAAGLSPAHFSQMFRKSTGESPHQFVLRHKVERAKEMLRAAEQSVLDVALACGFKTQQHFARVFRRNCGVSPTEYRHEFLSNRKASLNGTVVRQN